MALLLLHDFTSVIVQLSCGLVKDLNYVCGSMDLWECKRHARLIYILRFGGSESTGTIYRVFDLLPRQVPECCRLAMDMRCSGHE